ncbi:MAG: hypothetical protein AAF196_00135 [Planctomycetota bacterium]
MSRLRPLRVATVVFVAAYAATSCTGPGSDIGPSLGFLEQSIFRVAIRDGSGQPLVDARATLGTVSVLTAASGTAEFEVPFSSSTTLDLDGALASAVDGQSFGRLRIDLPAPASIDGQVPFTISLPDLSDSPEQPTTMPLGGGVVLDDTARSGAVVTFAAGTSFGTAIDPVRLGELSSDRVPPLDLSTGPISVNDAVFLAPLSETITPPASLQFPSTLGVPGGTVVTIARLSPTTGIWESIGPGSISGDGASVLAPSLASSGGLYTAFMSSASVDLVGRVLLDEDSQAAGQNLLVRSGQATATTTPDGLFSLEDVPLRSSVTLRVDGGLDAGSDIVEFDVDLSSAVDGEAIDVGDLLYPFVPTTDFRGQIFSRSELRRFARIGVNSLSGDRGVAISTDANGEIEVSDVIGGLISIFDTTLNPRNPQQVLAIENFLLVDLVQRTDDNQVFTDLQSLGFPAAATLLFVRDRTSRGFPSDVCVLEASETGDLEVIGATTEIPPGTPPLVVTPSREPVLAVARRETPSGDSFVSAQSIFGESSGRIEFLVDTRPTPPRATTVTVSGTIPGAGPEFELITAPILDRDGFFELFLDEYPIGAALSAPTDGAGSGDPMFEAAVRARAGSVLVATSSTLSGARRQLNSASTMEIDPANRASSVPAEFATVSATSMVEFTRGLVGLDPALVAAEPRAVVGYQRVDGRVVVLGSNLAVIGQPDGDGAVVVPAAQGAFAAATPIGFLEVADDASSVRRRQVSVFTRGPEVDAPLLPVPTINSPSDGDTVTEAGFDVEFSLPADVLYGRVSLVRDDGLVEWSALVPPGSTSVRFDPLSDDEVILEAGNYELKVEATRVAGDSPHLAQSLEPYQSFVGRQLSLGSAESLVTARSSIAFDIQIVP